MNSPEADNGLRAFTLIELLVVVAIIAILAAIAIPNFLAAQTRAKVSRVRADLRTVAVALDAYRIDWQEYPPTRGANRETDPVHALDGYDRRCGWGFRTISLRLSTPTAYLTVASIPDPFKRGADMEGWPYASGNPADEALGYHNIHELVLIDMVPEAYPDDFYADYGYWRIFSLGPNKTFDAFGQADLRWAYDPTNGTISSGQIIRTHMDEEGTHIAIPDPFTIPDP